MDSFGKALDKQLKKHVPEWSETERLSVVIVALKEWEGIKSDCDGVTIEALKEIVEKMEGLKC